MKRLLATLLPLLLVAQPAFAFTDSDDETLDFKESVGSHYYDAYSNICNDGLIGYYDGQRSNGLSSLQASFVDQYHDIAEKLSIEFGIPWETVVAQGILESAAGTSNFAVNRNNFFGIGAFDSNPDAAKSYPTPTAGWRGYYENIQKTATYRNHNAFSHPDDPYKYLEAIKAAGYATDPNYIAKISKLIAAIENRSQEKGWASSKELTEAHPEMISNANQNAQGANIAETSAGTIESVGCITDPTANGDIVSTALKYAWPNEDDTCSDGSSIINWSSDPRRCYNDIKPAYQAAVENLFGTQPLSYYQDCGHFVSAVIRSSDTDSNFPQSGTGNMLPYLQSHPELWAEVENLGNTSNLQPGDVFINRVGEHGHIMIFTGDTSFGNNASASLGERTGNMGSIFFHDSHNNAYHIFRFTGGQNAQVK